MFGSRASRPHAAGTAAVPAQAADPIEIECYGPVARAVHWLVAGLAVIVVVLGWAIPEAPRETQSRDVLLVLHRSVGLLILVLMVFRVLWRLGHPAPPLPAGFPRLEALAAYADHALLYLMFLVMPLSGYLNAAFAGHPVSFFGLVTIPPLLPESGRLSQVAIAVHLTSQFLVYGLVAVHVGAALMHRFVRRNTILERMLPLRRAG
jgi:cytochrome b561